MLFVAPLMFAQLAGVPLLSHFCHWYERPVGDGVYVPGVSVVGVPTVGVPLTATGVFVTVEAVVTVARSDVELPSL